MLISKKKCSMPVSKNIFMFHAVFLKKTKFCSIKKMFHAGCYFPTQRSTYGATFSKRCILGINLSCAWMLEITENPIEIRLDTCIRYHRDDKSAPSNCFLSWMQRRWSWNFSLVCFFGFRCQWYFDCDGEPPSDQVHAPFGFDKPFPSQQTSHELYCTCKGNRIEPMWLTKRGLRTKTKLLDSLHSLLWFEVAATSAMWCWKYL